LRGQSSRATARPPRSPDRSPRSADRSPPPHETDLPGDVPIRLSAFERLSPSILSKNICRDFAWALSYYIGTVSGEPRSVSSRVMVGGDWSHHGTTTTKRFTGIYSAVSRNRQRAFGRRTAGTLYSPARRKCISGPTSPARTDGVPRVPRNAS